MVVSMKYFLGITILFTLTAYCSGVHLIIPHDQIKSRQFLVYSSQSNEIYVILRLNGKEIANQHSHYVHRTFNDLIPYTTYSIDWRYTYTTGRWFWKKTRWRWGSTYWITTAQENPTPPQSLSSNDEQRTESSAQLQWIPPANMHGKLEYYRIVCEAKGITKVDQRTSDTFYLLISLQPATAYSCLVYAINGAGSSSASNKIQFITRDGKSKPITNFYMTLTSVSHIKLTWNAPLVTHGKLKFFVVSVYGIPVSNTNVKQCQKQIIINYSKTTSIEVNKNLPKSTCSVVVDSHDRSSEDPVTKPAHIDIHGINMSRFIYSIEIYPINDAGVGEMYNFKTDQSTGPLHLNVEEITTVSGKLIWKIPSDFDATISHFEINCPTHSHKIKQTKTSFELLTNLHPLTSYMCFVNVDRQGNKMFQSSVAFVTKQIKVSEVKNLNNLIVTDNTFAVSWQRPLLDNENIHCYLITIHEMETKACYKQYLLVSNSNNCSGQTTSRQIEHFNCSQTEISKIEDKETLNLTITDMSLNSMSYIVNVQTFGCSNKGQVASIVVRNEMKEEENSNFVFVLLGIILLAVASAIASIVLYKRKVWNNLHAKLETELNRQTTISIIDIPQYVQNLELTGGYAKQFENIIIEYNSKQEQCAIDSQTQIRGAKGNQTVSANWINIDQSNSLWCCNCKWIASESPNANTLDRFCQMIWDCDVDVIIMLTDTDEDGFKQCEQYWPSGVNNVQVLKDFKIHLHKENRKAGFIQRTLHLSNRSLKRRRVIQQIQFVEWKKFEIPTVDVFEKIHRECFLIVKEAVKMQKNKILVHCSDGLGRTGIFLVIMKLCQDLKVSSDNSIDVVETILSLRFSRPNMIQTERQLQFIYHYLLHVRPLIMQRKFLR